MSTFNWDAIETQYFVDQLNKMMLTQNPSWNPDGENGAGDAIGRNKDSYFAYRDPRFVEGVKNCWVKKERKTWLGRKLFGEYYYKGHRYPTPEYLEKDMSRDHTTNTFVLMHLAGEKEWAKELATHIKWVITKKHKNSSGKIVGRHSFIPAMWAWMKFTFAGKWWWAPVFYIFSFIEIILYNIINGFCYLMGWFSRELLPEDYNSQTMTRQKQSKWRQFWSGLTYPIYALNLFAWQLFVMKDNFFKRVLQYMAYPLVPRYNYLLKLLFNVGKVTKEQVLEYRMMKGGRWTTPLNEINDRSVEFITDEKLREFNRLDEDLLIAMWNYRNPNEMIKYESTVCK